MTTPTYNCFFGTPNYGDPTALYTPTIDGGAWLESLPLTYLQDRRITRAARSVDALNTNTRLRVDLKTDRQVQRVVVPNAYRGVVAPISSSGKVRVLGVPSSLLFDYEAGDDVVALGGTFTRTPTTDVRAATYVDRNGVVKYAGENLALRSQSFDNASWTKTTTSTSADSIAGPTGTTTADTLTASAGNGTTIQDLGVLASAAFCFSVWLKRKTGSGSIQLTLDGGSTWTTKTLTTKWQRFYITQTLANPDCGIRIVTNADAVYAWGAQAEHGTTPTGYVPTTSAINSAIRDGHFIGGYRHTLLEDARTNLVVQSDALATGWSLGVAGTPTNAVATYAGRPFSRFAYNPANDYIFRNVTLTGNAVKAFSLLLKYDGVAGDSYHGFFDATAGAYRGLVKCTWTSAGTMTAVAQIGTLIQVESLADSVYRVSAVTTSCTAANTNQAIPVANAGTVTSILVSGVQVEDAAFPSSLIPTTTATVARSADSLSFAESFVPQALTIYTKHTERGTISGTNAGIVSVGNAVQFAALYAVSGKYNFKQQGTAGSETETAAAAPSVGDTVELRGTMTAAGAVTLGQSINSAAEAVTATSATSVLNAAFASLFVYIGGEGSLLNRGYGAIQSIRIAAGVQTLAYMQAIVYDSGWLCQYPTGATSETLAGMNVPHALVIPSTQTAFRYCSVQVDDESNTAGYVDLGRLYISGGYQASVNMAQGAEQEFETASEAQDTDGGAVVVTERPVKRVKRFTNPQLPESEAETTVHDMMRQLGIVGQFWFEWNPTDTSADYLHRRSMFCRYRAPGKIQHAFHTYFSASHELVEEL